MTWRILCCSYLIVTARGSVTVYVCVCLQWTDRRTQALSHIQTCMWLVGWLVGWCVLSRPLGLFFDLKSIIVHLNNLACVWTNCVGMSCQNWILLNMHFCVHLKTAKLKKKKKKKTVMSNLFIVVSVLLENPVFRCTLYIQCCTLQRYTLFWYNIVQ